MEHTIVTDPLAGIFSNKSVVTTSTSSYDPFAGILFENSTNPVVLGNFTVTYSVNSSVWDVKNVVTATVASVTESVFESKLIIPLYVVIFVLSIVGNSLVLITLVQNKRMRTVTNVYLLNLAISDLLLGVFCMPFTLLGQVLRNFIFGAAMCKLIPYFQVVSVSVAVWTLVAISLERYFAICRPLKSRRWQTQFHAYKMIVMVWLASLVWSSPVLVVSSLKATKERRHKCREVWPGNGSEQAYNLFLDALLLLVPLIFMGLAYSLIMTKLWKGLKREIQHNTNCQQQAFDRSSSSLNVNSTLVRNNNASTTTVNSLASLRTHRLTANASPRENIKASSTGNTERNGGGGSGDVVGCNSKGRNKKQAVKKWLMKGIVQVSLPGNASRGYCNYSSTKTTVVPRYELATTNSTSQGNPTPTETENNVDETTYTFTRQPIRSNYMDKSIEAKKKVIRMLFVIVAEFFVCWAPLHIINTWYVFYPAAVYQYVGSTGISLVQLLAYISSCCNPITYCFMNRKFRQAFLGVFHCCRMCCWCRDVEDTGTPGSNTRRNGNGKMAQNNSDISGNDSTVYVGRASTLGRSEILVLEAEDRV
ncbi:cholecystokinin receptor type A-like [Onthophagus taurus]|uniref:cholecystokinin receptor type A-like n=1 Tax=Onthophagus taurus TaxID=166361 RepID=UPI0039BE6A42